MSPCININNALYYVLLYSDTSVTSTNRVHQEHIQAHHAWLDKYGVVVRLSACPETQMEQSGHSDDVEG